MQIAKQNLLVVGSHYILKYLASGFRGIVYTRDRAKLIHLLQLESTQFYYCLTKLAERNFKLKIIIVIGMEGKKYEIQKDKLLSI